MDTSRRTTYSTFLLRTFDDLRKFDPNFRERIVDNSQRAKIRQSRQCSPNRIQNNDVADRAGRGKKTKKRNKDRERERKENRFLLDARTRRKKRSTWTDGFSPREEEEEEGGEKRVSRLIASGRYLATVASIRNSNLIIPWMQLGAG